MKLITSTKLARLADTTCDRVVRYVKSGKLVPTAELYTGAPLFDTELSKEYIAVLAKQEGR
jgi:hypothetical protein